MAGATESVEFLKRLLEVARDVVGAERAEADGRLDDYEVLDPDKGALTQILEEFAPPDTPIFTPLPFWRGRDGVQRRSISRRSPAGPRCASASPPPPADPGPSPKSCPPSRPAAMRRW